ncbi:hypothetical protein D1831_02430 [Lactiplantibacillus garii]|uniref:DUF2812 domain-containing protein n=1 Tax=Lactiplantibacillus garii TaxID=2306423 RepID=A0A426D9V5_9LACO|nr:hypothetical protein [Lactiplantibacillus garii]RRK11408.1 hypothetical protein D1831_02430 [Lactiplantibacillus garii]
MQKIRFFLKGSAAETAWLNRQAQRGYQLTGIKGMTYQFKAVPDARPVVAEYLRPATLTAMADVFHPLTTFTFNNGKMAVAYSSVQTAQRVVSDDNHYRLAVYRRAREVALNWMNGWVVGIWLLMCVEVMISTKLTATPLLTSLLLGSFGVGAGMIVAAIVICGTAAGRFHGQVCRLIRITGEDKGTWKPTFHVVFRHQQQVPDTEAWAELGNWRLAMQNQQGDYYFNLETNLSEREIRNTLLKMIKPKDFDVLSWLGLYPL